MSYLPEGVKAENLLNNIRVIGQKVSHILKSYSQSNLKFNEFREKLDIKNINDDIVTEADLKVNEVIKNSLGKDYLNVDWDFLSEEDFKVRKVNNFNSDWVWIIDPLDGTRDFVSRSGEYASHIALAYKKKIIMASIIVPSKEQLWFFTEQKGTWCEDLLNHKLQFSRKPYIQEKEMIITKSRSHSNEELENLLVKLKPKKVVGMGSVGYKITSIIRGEADLYISYSLPGKSSPKDWDMAAPEAILRGLGGCLTDINGRRIQFLEDGFNQEGIIIGSLNPNHFDICKTIRELLKL